MVGFLALYALLLPFAGGLDIPVALPAGFDSVADLAGLIALGALAAHVAFARRRAGRLPRAAPVWVLFFAVSLLTYLWSVNPPASADSLLVLGSLLALYLAAVLAGAGRRDVSRLEAAIALGGAVTGAIAAYQLLTGDIALSGGDVPRFRMETGGQEGDPNITAASLLLPFAVAVARTTGVGTPVVRAGYGAAAALTAGAIVLTASRGGIVALVVALVVLAAAERRRGTLVAYAVLPAVAMAVVLALAPDALTGRFGSEESTGRTAIWSLAFGACPRYCLAGSGWGTFPDVHEREVLASPSGKGTELRYEAHNVFIAVAIEAGMVALVLALMALALTALDLRRLPAPLRGPPLAALAAVLAANMFVANLEYKYFWLVLIYASLMAEAGRRWERWSEPVH